MESVQSEPETKERQLTELSGYINALSQQKDNFIDVRSMFAPKEETRLEKAKKLASDVAVASRNLDDAVIKVGTFFEEIISSDELEREKISQEITAKGGLPIEEFPLAVPQLDDHILEQFALASQIIIHEVPSTLRDQAMLLMSICNELIFQRQILDKELFDARESRRKILVEYMLSMTRNPQNSLRRFG